MANRVSKAYYCLGFLNFKYIFQTFWIKGTRQMVSSRLETKKKLQALVTNNNYKTIPNYC